MTTYWFDVFTSKTCEELRDHAFAVTGFSGPKYGIVKQVQPGDIFICYLKGAKKLIGPLRAAGELYLSAEPPIWGEGAFPARVPVEPLVILDAQQAVDFTQVLPALSFYNPTNLRSAYAVLQGSPTRLKGVDGEAMLQSLEDASDAQRASAPAVTPFVAADEAPAEERSDIGQEGVNPPKPLTVVDPLQALLDELVAAQRDAAKPARFERIVAGAFRLLGFDVAVLGQAERTALSAASVW